ncbi:GNAT family N-acetyltransferase [Croceivirga sp. JEA036]|uniref:GNAT family N-acetyltransferase n=1 Tax=Croceivirga sp. JEA036 TaxID=2721162 RepID=UPI00143A2876|nr:GNAT family N-acetyltransferase [Croceivirga sp. JEA036]NJB37075.1 GNAT family N-acetyltransferase [Croceivirga sp. JEA036]
MQIERLEWDSEFFGYEIGKLSWEQTFDFQFLKGYALESNYRLIYIFSETPISELETYLVDRKVVLSRDLNDCISTKDDLQLIVPYKHTAENFTALLELVLESGVYSRFKLDKNFENKEYEKLYEEWIKKSLEKDKHVCYVYLDNNLIHGFITLEEKENYLSDINLIAVHNSARGKGIGNKLINKSIQISKKRGLTKIQVATQMANSPAMKLYKKNGFRIQKVSHIYHYWNI